MITEDSSAHIEQNDLNDNIKSNIAFGGRGSVNTVVIKNKIHNGRCEGIFIIDGGKSYITRNKIFENNNGMILITSSPIIMQNKIYKNKFNGILNFFCFNL